MEKLSRGFQRFHAYLQTLKVDQRVTWKQILGATGWKESTLQTYLRKNKLAGFLAELPKGSFQVLRNGDSITEADIAGALSQVTPEVMSLYKGEKLKGESSLYVLEKKLGEGAVGHVWAAHAEKGNARRNFERRFHTAASLPECPITPDLSPTSQRAPNARACWSGLRC